MKHRIAPPAQRPPTQHGFTLVEVLVVVLIIGVLITFASLSIGDRALADRLETEASRLEQLFRLAQEEAELQGYEMGFLHTDESYQFLVVSPEGRWLPVVEGMFRERPTPPLELSLRVEDRPVAPAQRVEVKPPKDDEDEDEGKKKDDKQSGPQPQVLILSSGELTAFTLNVTAPGLENGYRLAGTALGKLTLEMVERKDY